MRAVSGQAQRWHTMSAPSHPADRDDDSSCQVLPLARWAVTYLQLLFSEGKQLAGGLMFSRKLQQIRELKAHFGYPLIVLRAV